MLLRWEPYAVDPRFVITMTFTELVNDLFLLCYAATTGKLEMNRGVDVIMPETAFSCHPVKFPRKKILRFRDILVSCLAHQMRRRAFSILQKDFFS